MVFAINVCQVVNSLYFMLAQERKCFQIEQPQDTPLFFSYEILDSKHKIEFELYYGIDLDVKNRIIVKEFEDAIGHVDYVTDFSGTFTYCLRQTESDDSSSRFKINVNYGFDEEYYEKLSKEKKIDVVNTETHKINDLLTLTINEADYQKHKEVEYHAQTESMNNAVLWWPLGQIGILVVIGIFQVKHLKTFFKNNKLI